MYYEDNDIKLYNKDCRDMSELKDESIQCVVTSPPYWGLRKYSGEQELVWPEPPSDNPCKHEWTIKDRMLHSGTNAGKVQLGDRGSFHNNASTTDNTCSLCGAWKGSYGLEPTPEMYIEHTIEILREIRRVLRKDGVVFWNIGDSYWSTAQGTFNAPHKITGAGSESRATQYRPKGGKPKDLCLIPFRVAIAAQEDGWWVRSVIIWSKPNPMPESVTDRPTESHEYILMLTKSARYYWDADAVREPLAEGSWERSLRSELDAHSESRIRNKGTGEHGRANLAGRNIRSVWEFPTQPYPEAHFAVFPEKLPELCFKVSTPEVGCCSKCGSPWERITETSYNKRATRYPTEKYADTKEGKPNPGDFMGDKITETLGWQPTCKCNADKVPSVVLDPFAGAGTTLWVAKKLNRKAVGYELSEEYCQLAVKRNRQQGLL